MNNQQKLIKLLCSILKTDEAEIEKASSETIDSWDSLQHMNIIVALEEEFSVRFDEEEVFEIASFDLISRSLIEKGIILEER